MKNNSTEYLGHKGEGGGIGEALGEDCPEGMGTKWFRPRWQYRHGSVSQYCPTLCTLLGSIYWLEFVIGEYASQNKLFFVDILFSEP